jgi:hypothetical protein
VTGQNIYLVLGQSEGSVARAAVWVLVLLGVVVIGGALAVYIRHRANANADSPAIGLSLADLRRMKAEGRLSEDEFERAKVMVIGELGGKVDGAEAERVRIQGRIVDGELRARPGYDLTGQPLPQFGSGEGPEGDSPDPAVGQDGPGAP